MTYRIKSNELRQNINILMLFAFVFQNDRTSIHKNLCGCLLIAEVVFLGGVNQTGNSIVCGIVAGVLHYFFLAAFAWMFMEGLLRIPQLGAYRVMNGLCLRMIS